jgi:hypothetical protein
VREQNISLLCEKRRALIHELERGNLNKEHFILENYEMLKSIKYVDLAVNTVDEGILKYHYFNTMAKMKMLAADEVEYRDPEGCKTLREAAYELYTKKERITLGLIELKGFQNISAYYIDLNSKALCGQVFEIVIRDLDYAILHSRDRKVLFKLKSAGCFEDCVKPSLIHDYVNTKVY